jgi:predicted transcriptional regulator
VSKQAAQKVNINRFNKRSERDEINKQCQVEIANTFPALENAQYSEDVNVAWDTVRENIKNSFKEGLVCC